MNDLTKTARRSILARPTAVLLLVICTALFVRPAQAAAIKDFTVNLRAGTPARERSLIVTYFRRYGLAVDERDAEVLFVRGTYAQAAAAGATEFGLARVGTTRFLHAIRPPHFPREIGHGIVATTIDDGPAGASSGIVPDFDQMPPVGYTPADLAAYYDETSLPPGVTGSGENVAIISCGTFDAMALSAFERNFGLAQNAPTVVSVDGGSTYPYQGETQTDVERLVSTAPQASITLYVLPYTPGAPCTLSQLADGFAAVAADMPTKHYAAVTSGWSASEDFYDATGAGQTLTAEHADIASIVNRGGAVVVPSGSWGAGPPDDERQSEGEFTVQYPASDGLAIGVGGTSAIPQSASNPTRVFELAWGSSGGGVSTKFAIPKYQRGLAGVPSTTMRNVPDVAFDADLNTGAEFYYPVPHIRYAAQYVGGTELGADTWAGMIALVDQERASAGKAPLKAVAAKLYAARKTAGTLTAIAKGCNGYYCADVTPYSAVVGIGVPDIAKMVAALAALP